MQETYKLNHPDVEVLGDVCSADYTAIQNKYGSIDIVIGGPPCQGFSNANRQKNHAISQNNMLVKQYIEVYRDGKICHGGMSRGPGERVVFAVEEPIRATDLLQRNSIGTPRGTECFSFRQQQTKMYKNK